MSAKLTGPPRYAIMGWAVLLTDDGDADGVREWMVRDGFYLSRTEAEARFASEEAFAKRNRSADYTIRPSRIAHVEVREIQTRAARQAAGRRVAVRHRVAEKS